MLSLCTNTQRQLAFFFLKRADVCMWAWCAILTMNLTEAKENGVISCLSRGNLCSPPRQLNCSWKCPGCRYLRVSGHHICSYLFLLWIWWMTTAALKRNALRSQICWSNHEFRHTSLSFKSSANYCWVTFEIFQIIRSISLVNIVSFVLSLSLEVLP